jgi:hypothetical protein
MELYFSKNRGLLNYSSIENRTPTWWRDIIFKKRAARDLNPWPSG